MIFFRKQNMTTPLTRGMAKVSVLTRSGKLHEATRMIQSLLGGSARYDTATDDLSGVGALVDGEYTEVNPAPIPQAAEKPLVRKTKKISGRATTLAQTLRKIAAGGMPLLGQVSGAVVPVPAGAQFLALTHSTARATRSYRLYIPANRPAGSMPLIVMLHGCTQNAEDFAAGTGMNALAEEFGLLIAYPTQPSGANAQKCWNWYRPEDQARDGGEPAVIAGLTRDIQRDHGADPARTYVAGLSAGGAAAAVMAAAYPEVFRAVGVHSGLPAGGARDIPSAFAAMRGGSKGRPHQTTVPTIVFHGRADTTVHPDNGTAVLEQAIQAMPGLRVTTRRGVSEGGRGYSARGYLDTDGRSLAEIWEIDGAGHAWAGGSSAGSYTDPYGPDASREMVRFFLQHKQP